MAVISAILCVMAVETLSTKKVPSCCTAAAAAARTAASGPAGPVEADLVPIATGPNRFLPIAPAEAEQINAERPLSGRPLQAAPPTLLPSSWQPEAREAARRCLAAAVYYEASGEGWHGELSVAQVVLNRVRHPAYPKTICETVYQGSNLPTGCQFTFTCDGRLAHPPSPAGWKQAEAVANAALSGTVEPRVGMSTHYHTRSVVPYWASSLDKLAVVGNHIFYTFAGPAGNRRAFSGSMLADAATLGNSPVQASEPKAVAATDGEMAPVAPLPSAASRIRADAVAPVRLAADEGGSLLARGGTLLQPPPAEGLLRLNKGDPLR